MKINKKLVSLKAYYFCNYAAVGALLPFLTVYLKKLGINSTEAGFIAGFTQLLSIFIRPASGALADKQQKHKTLLLIMLALYGTAYFSLMFVPVRDVYTSILGNWSCSSAIDLTMKCSLETSDVKLNCFQNTNIKTNISKIYVQNCHYDTVESREHSEFNNTSALETLCQNAGIDMCQLKLSESYSLANNSVYCCKIENQTWMLDLTIVLAFTAFLFARISYSCMQSLLDTITYSMLESNRLLYSRQRLWGTAGTTFSTVTVIFAIGLYYNSIFYIFGVFCLLAFIVGLTLDIKHFKREEVKLLKILRVQITQPSIRWFLFKILCYGMFLGTMMNFLYWYFKDIGISESFLGVTSLIQCFSSMVVLQFAPKILQTFGQDNCMSASLCVYAVRFIGHSFVRNQWGIIPLEMLHGVSYALFWAAASSKVSFLAPSGSQGMFQGIAGAVYNDLGRGIGTIITGVIFQHVNTRWAFRGYSILCISLLVIFWLLDRVWKSPVVAQQETVVKEDVNTKEKLLVENVGNEAI